MVEAFQFSATSQEIRTLWEDNETWFILKDLCDILGHTNPSVAIKMLDDDERGKKSLGRQGKTWVVNESGLYTLILRSNKPESKTFRKWVTSEVLPAIRKKGYYGTAKTKEGDYVDARDQLFDVREYNGIDIRFIDINGELWFSVNDIHKAIGARTESSQAVKKLNAVQTLAQKIWLFGNTHPAWFTNQRGFQLLVMGSRVLRANRQLTLNFKGGALC